MRYFIIFLKPFHYVYLFSFDSVALLPNPPPTHENNRLKHEYDIIAEKI